MSGKYTTITIMMIMVLHNPVAVSRGGVDMAMCDGVVARYNSAMRVYQ
jgi:hypothetical protein